MNYPYEHTPVGFRWGAAVVERLFSDKRGVALTVRGKRPSEALDIYVSAAGRKMRVFRRGKELK